VLSYKARADKVDEFEVIVQGLARCVYAMEASVTDVRVCHPCCGHIVFIITFIARDALIHFEQGPQAEFERSLNGIVCEAEAPFKATGTLMPAAHTLTSLLEYLKIHVKGSNHCAHNIRLVSKEIEKWFPRYSEYQSYIRINENDESQYTRNVVYCNEHFDCILMCWPPGAVSTIHDHDESSCWVTVVEGAVHEVQYQLPRFDRKFTEAETRDPATAVGHCGKLKVVSEARLDISGGVTSTYANNDIGIHRVENRSDKLACTLHIYAPPLRKMRVFDESGNVRVHVATSSVCGNTGSCIPCEGIFDFEAWNAMLHDRDTSA
jgi:cysteine dioxygenase